MTNYGSILRMKCSNNIRSMMIRRHESGRIEQVCSWYANSICIIVHMYYVKRLYIEYLLTNQQLKLMPAKGFVHKHPPPAPPLPYRHLVFVEDLGWAITQKVLAAAV